MELQFRRRRRKDCLAWRVRCRNLHSDAPSHSRMQMMNLQLELDLQLHVAVQEDDLTLCYWRLKLVLV